MSSIEEIQTNYHQEEKLIIEEFTTLLNEQNEKITKLQSSLNNLLQNNSEIKREKNQLIQYISNYLQKTGNTTAINEPNTYSDSEDELDILISQRDDLVEITQKTQASIEKANQDYLSIPKENQLLNQEIESQKKEIIQFREKLQNLLNENEILKVEESKIAPVDGISQKKIESLQNFIQSLQSEKSQIDANHQKEMSNLVNQTHELEEELKNLKSANENENSPKNTLQSPNENPSRTQNRPSRISPNPLPRTTQSKSPIINPNDKSNMENPIQSKKEILQPKVSSNKFSTNQTKQSIQPTQSVQLTQPTQQIPKSNTSKSEPKIEVVLSRSGPPIRKDIIRIKEEKNQKALSKKSGWGKFGVGIWKGYLCFFKAKNDTDPILEIKLISSVKINRIPKAITKKDNCISIKSKEGIFYLNFNNQQEFESWHQLLKTNQI